MSTMVDSMTNSTPVDTSPAERLRSTMIAMRLSFSWFGVRKSLTSEQRSEAAEAFGADGEVLSAGKRLIDTKHPKYRTVTNVRSRAVGLWKSVSLPFPEAGIRLIKRDDLGTVQVWMTTLKHDLQEAVSELDTEFVQLKEAARRRLGRLYNEADYPLSLQGLFDLNWDWPNVEAPKHLQQLSPELYQEECRRVRSRFDDAVHMAEQAFLEELEKLVSHLSERLSGSDDGKPKIFRDSAVENLTAFFGRFRDLNIGSSEELEDLVDRAQRVVGGIQPQQLRDSDQLRQQVATQLATVQSSLDGLLVDRPRRNILRRPR